MKYHGLGNLSNRNLFSHSYRGWKSKIKALADLVFFEASLLGLQTAAFLLRFPLCTHTRWCLSVSPNLFFSEKEQQSDWIKSPPNSLILTEVLPLDTVTF